MVFSKTSALVDLAGGRFEWREQCGSTNTELSGLASQHPSAWHDFSVFATANQIAGRGRSGRAWQAPAGSSLAISVLFRPNLVSQTELAKLSWLPLLAGLAMTKTVNSFLPEPKAKVKWPNDVLVGENKICGILSEVLPDLSGVVVGSGLNLTLTREQLPVETATSLAIEGADLAEGETHRFDEVLSDYLTNLRQWYQRFAAAGFDANKSGLRQAVIENCVTLNREVRAILPGDTEQIARAITIDDSGRLVLEWQNQVQAVSAGDIVHMRHN